MFLVYFYEIFDVEIENIWIVESSGKFVGFVGLVKYDEKIV